TNDERITNSEIGNRTCRRFFVIRISDFFRHSTFDIRHSTFVIRPSSFGLYLGRRVPVSSQPVGDQPNFPLGQYLLIAELRHAVIALAIIIWVGGIADETNEPLPGTVAGEVRRRRVFVALMELVAVGAFGPALEQRAAVLDEGGIVLVEGKLRLELGLGRDRRDDFAQVLLLLGGVVGYVFFCKFCHLAVVELRCAKIIGCADRVRVQQTGKPLARSEAFQIGGSLRVERDSAGAVVSGVTMAPGAFLGKE